MKIKRILIKSREEMQKESIAFAKRLDRGEKVNLLQNHYFESIEAVRRFLTDARFARFFFTAMFFPSTSCAVRGRSAAKGRCCDSTCARSIDRRNTHNAVSEPATGRDQRPARRWLTPGR